MWGDHYLRCAEEVAPALRAAVRAGSMFVVDELGCVFITTTGARVSVCVVVGTTAARIGMSVVIECVHHDDRRPEGGCHFPERGSGRGTSDLGSQRREAPILRTHIATTVTSAGEIPASRLACPSVRGLNRASVSTASRRSPRISCGSIDSGIATES